MEESPAQPPLPVLEYAPAPKSVGRDLARRFVPILIVLFVGALCGGLMYLLQPVTYTATGYLQENPPPTVGSEYVPTDINQLVIEQRTHAAAMNKLADTLHLKARVAPVPEQRLIEVTASDTNSAQAVRTVNALIDAYVPGHAQTIGVATRPPIPTIGRRDLVIPLSALLAGVIWAAVVIVIMRHARRERAADGGAPKQ